MTVYQKGSEKVENYREFHFLTSGQMGGLAREKTSRSSLDRDKKTRREIANSNERRRMQSINSGFQQLKALLPDSEDDKRSKSVILHQAVEYITKLETEKMSLINQNARLTHLLQDGRLVKRKRGTDCISSELESFQPDHMEILTKVERLARELRAQLDEERRRRLACERQLDSIKAALRNSSASTSSLLAMTSPNIVVSKGLSGHIKSPTTVTVSKALEDIGVIASPNVDVSFSLDSMESIVKTKNEDVDSQTAVNTIVSCSMSKRNLETIVEAIRHLEGDQDSISSGNQKVTIHSQPKFLEEQQNDILKVKTPLLQIPKQIHFQGHPQLLSIVQSCQLSSPYGSPLSSPPLPSTPPQVLQQPLSSPHHLISPIFICSPESSFLKSTSHMSVISAAEQS